jgi:hypothetical protein
MPQTDFYFSRADLKLIIEFVCDEGGRIVVDRHYFSPDYPEYRSWADVEAFVPDQGNFGVFLISREWERSRLEIHNFIRDGRTIYYISEKNGGPTINVSISQPVTKNGQRTLGQGSIHYCPRFWNPLSEEMEVPSEELKSFYKRIVTLLKKGATKVRWGPRTYYVTENARATGWRLAHIEVTF